MMETHFPVSIITPGGLIHREAEATRILAFGIDGELAILPGHISFLTPLRISELVIQSSEEKKLWAVAGGILEVTHEGTRIISSAAEEGYCIDVERAKRSAERARKRLSGSQKGIDPKRAARALRRAEVRLKVAASHHDHSD